MIINVTKELNVHTGHIMSLALYKLSGLYAVTLLMLTLIHFSYYSHLGSYK